MNWRSLADLHRAVGRELHHLPAVDAVVGVPRSGMLPATLLALWLELPLADVDGAVAGRWWGRKTTPSGPLARVLLVDDSARTGKAMGGAVRRLVAGLPGVEVVRLAVFAAPAASGQVDVALETLPLPRVFEWNLWRHTALRRIATDLDGVLCPDPPTGVDDDGPRYAEWIEQVPPLHLPRLPVRAIVTCRLERYRPQTEQWLAKHGVRYGQLHMVDLPSGAERRRLKVHVPHKVTAYRESGAELFVESSAKQAAGIAKATGRPVLCWRTRSLA